MSEQSLTVEQAVASLDAAEAPAPKKAAAPAAAASEAELSEDVDLGDDEQELEADPNPADDASEASEEDEPGDGDDADDDEQVEASAQDAPQWWDAEDKAWFATLTPEAQGKFLKQEGKREAVVTRVKAEAAEERKAMNEERQGIQNVAETLSSWLPKAVQAFNEYWGPEGFDLELNIQEHGLETALILQSRHEKELSALSNVAQVNERAVLESKIAYQRAQRELLKTECPELTDPRDGAAREKELASYLLKQGADASDLETLPAWAVRIAYQGMQFERAKAKATTLKTAKPSVSAAVRPSAAQPVPSKTRTAAKAANRFAQTRSIDDLVAALDAESP